MADLGLEVFLTLLSNETDVEKMSEAGVQADYLQVGFDHIRYQRRTRIKGWPDIVFVANNYDKFELSRYRAEVVLAMYEAFPHQFRVFGAHWHNLGIQTQALDNALEAECYNSCKIALSISSFHYQRYYSDRLLRIIGCGCCAISHSFPGLEKDFVPGHDIVTYSGNSDLIEKCNYYLRNEDERRKIGNNAFITAHSKCTWDVRCRELIELINRYE
jgi:spore maturation protein CgeB